MLFITLVLGILYLFLIFLAINCWKLSSRATTKYDAPQQDISIIIPFRNEAHHLIPLIENLKSQTLSSDKYKVVFINDHSEDHGETLIPADNERFIIIDSEGQGKKQAIRSGWKYVQSDYILQTDADTTFQKNWLSRIQQYISSRRPVFCTGPVMTEDQSTFLGFLQSMELMSIIGMTKAGITMGWWHMANGANMVYHTSLCQSIQQDTINARYASGDDMFLIQQAVRNNHTIKFMHDREAIVWTQSCKTFKELIAQRIRWGSKNHALKDTGLQIALGVIVLFNVLLSLITLLCIFGMISLHWVLFIWLSKLIVDFIYLKIMASFYSIRVPIVNFLLCALIYPFYLFYISVMILITPSYEWKGRKVS